METVFKSDSNPKSFTRETEKNKVRNEAEFSIERDLLKRVAGSDTAAKCYNSDGEAVVAKAYVVANDRIEIVISDPSLKNRIKINIAIQEDGQATVSNGISSRQTFIPAYLPLEIINTLFLSSYVVEFSIASKALQPPIPFKQTPQANRPGGGKCIDHDLLCTDLFFKFTSDKQHMRWWLPCVGSFDVNVVDCCIKHDIDLWCSPDLAHARQANIDVVACIMDKIGNAVYRKKDEANWICDILIAIWETVTGIVGGLLGLIGAVVGIIGEALNAILHVLDFITFDVIPQEAYDAIDAITVFAYGGAVGYNEYGAFNLDSCLCGGRVPTTLCCYEGDSNETCINNYCTNLCKGDQDCDWCYFECTYDADNNLQAPRLIIGPRGLGGCCPGSDGDTAYICRTPEDFNRTCPECSNCFWDCDLSDINNPKWVVHKDKYNLNCCQGLPGLKPTRGCDFKNGRFIQ